jgi:hypothetical protein
VSTPQATATSAAPTVTPTAPVDSSGGSGGSGSSAPPPSSAGGAARSSSTQASASTKQPAVGSAGSLAPGTSPDS